ncbi:MAG: DEAD/DEAH box helicase, partial [Prochlorotrichaceae cyanobacterium]
SHRRTNPDGFIPATIVWQTDQDTLHYNGYHIPQPQELLLRGLGLALRLYPLLEASLDTAEPLHCELSTAEAYSFIKTIAPRLGEQGLAVILPPGLSRGVANRLGLQVKAELAAPSLHQSGTLGLNNLLQFRWELCLGGQTFSKAAFDRLVAQDTPLVQVNGEWLELRTQDVIAAREFFKRRKDQPNLSLEDALRLSTGETPTLSKLPVVNFEATGALQSLVTTLTGTQPVEPLAAPTGFRGQLRPYQERGAGWLNFLHRWNLGACLADDMGLGKTVQFIAFLLNLYDRSQLKYPYLLICPTSVLGNWEREIKRFAPKLNVWVHHGEKRQKGNGLKTIALKQQLVLTSYNLVHRDLPDLKTIPWQGVVLDEAQNIKNAEAKQSVAVRELTWVNLKNAQNIQGENQGQNQPSLPFRIALTGTPVENHLTELWSIMEFLNPGYLGTKAFFQRRFSVPIERYGDRSSLESLRSLVQPFILRRLKTDRSIIQDLPEKQEMTVFCGLSAEQGNLYQTVVDDTLKTIEKAEGIEKHGLILGLLTKLKQICNHPCLYLKETLRPETVQTFAKRSSKIQRLESLLEELLTDGDMSFSDYASQNRALLFTQFAEWGKLLKFYFEQRWNQEVLFLYGSTSKNDRQRLIDRFQEDPQAPRLFILSLKAGGVGLNLTRANHVFHIDRWWNPAVENQATDRAFRIGQNRKVQVHKFVCSGTLEERIHDLMEAKKALAEQVVGTGESWLTQLDTDQLRDLLLLNRDTIEE